jgi:hypothetical protein
MMPCHICLHFSEVCDDCRICVCGQRVACYVEINSDDS